MHAMTAEPMLAGEPARLLLAAPLTLDAGMFDEDVISDIRLLTTKVTLMGKWIRQCEAGANVSKLRSTPNK
jgi:hypothetical protein